MNQLKKDEKIFYLSETNDIIVLNDKVKWWDKFNLSRYATYVKKKFFYHLSRINMN